MERTTASNGSSSSKWTVTTSAPSTPFSLDEPLCIQVASDLHLELPTASRRLPEVYGLTFTNYLTHFNLKVLQEVYGTAEGNIPVISHSLALLGDIGYPSLRDYEAFLLHQAQRFERIFVLAGNHEFYRYCFCDYCR